MCNVRCAIRDMLSQAVSGSNDTEMPAVPLHPDLHHLLDTTSPTSQHIPVLTLASTTASCGENGDGDDDDGERLIAQGIKCEGGGSGLEEDTLAAEFVLKCGGIVR